MSPRSPPLFKSLTGLFAAVLGSLDISHWFSFQNLLNLSLPSSARLALYCVTLFEFLNDVYL